MEHPSYEKICRQQEDERCHAPASFATVIYSTSIESGASEPLYDIAPQCAPPFTNTLLRDCIAVLDERHTKPQSRRLCSLLPVAMRHPRHVCPPPASVSAARPRGCPRSGMPAFDRIPVLPCPLHASLPVRPHCGDGAIA